MTTDGSRVLAGREGFPHAEHCRLVERGRIRWSVTTMGRGPAMLLLHGTGSSSHSFRGLMPLLAERFTVIAPDLPGHAFSEAPRWFEPSVSGMAAAVGELLDALNAKPVVAVGHSAGAAILARLALDGCPSLKLLVGLGAALCPLSGVARAVLPSTARILSSASKLVTMRVPNGDGVARALASTGSSLDPASIALYRRLSERPSHVAGVLGMLANWDLEPLFDELEALHLPLLLLAGEGDRAISLADQRKAAARAPKARLVVLPALGHLLHEEDPARVARAILDEANALSTENANKEGPADDHED